MRPLSRGVRGDNRDPVDLISPHLIFRMDTDTTTARIRALNDTTRRMHGHEPVHVTQGISALPLHDQAAILDRVCAFNDFTEDNDPYGEHDFGILKLDGATIYWKIDLYDNDLKFGSPDPEDPSVTSRVLTILLAEEY